MTEEQPTEVTPTGGGDEPKTLTITQEQLDAMFKPRTEEAAQKARAALLAEIGVEDVKAVKDAINAAEQAKQAQMTELEKAQAAAEKAKVEIEKAQAERDAALAQAAEALFKSAVEKEASKQEFNDPTDAWVYLNRAKVEADVDGTYKGLSEAVKAVGEAKPYLLKADTAPAPKGTPTRQRHPLPAPQTSATPERSIVRF